MADGGNGPSVAELGLTQKDLGINSPVTNNTSQEIGTPNKLPDNYQVTNKPQLEPSENVSELSNIQPKRELAEQELEKSEVKPTLEEELRIIYDQNFSTFGHGTTIERIQEVLTTGLKAKVDKLDTTTIPLFDHSKSYDEQARQLINQIMHWPHLDSKAIVLVMIPNKPEEVQVGGNTYFNSVFEKLPEDQKSEYANYVIPPRYVRGIVNVDTKQFMLNPDFDPVVPEVKQNRQDIHRANLNNTGRDVVIPTGTSDQSGDEDFVF